MRSVQRDIVNESTGGLALMAAVAGCVPCRVEKEPGAVAGLFEANRTPWARLPFDAVAP